MENLAFIYIGSLLVLVVILYMMFKKSKEVEKISIEYKTELDSLKLIKQEQDFKVNSLTDKVQELDILKNDLIQKNKTLETIKEEKQKIELTLSANNEQLKEFTSIKENNSLLADENKIKTQEISDLKSKLIKSETSLIEQIDKYADFKSNSENEISSLKNELAQLKTLNDSLQEDIKKTKINASELNTELDQIKLNQDTLLNAKTEQIIELKNELDKLKIQNNTLQEDSKQIKVKSSELNTELEQIKLNHDKLITSKSEQIEELKSENNKLRVEQKSLNETVKEDKALISQLQTKLDEQNISMQEKFDLLKNSEEKLKQEFENLANKIFTDNSKKFSEQNQKDLGLILNPMKQQLGEFKKKVEDVYDKESKDRSALQQELKTLKDLNIRMSEEAHKLTTALTKDNKKQGNWGEVVLDKVLESSGLRLNHEYTKQLHLKDNEDKSFKPDVVVHLPDNRDIIIDAKTSLTAYNQYINEVEDDLKQVYLKSHIRSVKDHIKGLADKKYEDLKGVNTLDFIFMFIPIEGALLSALDNDVNLYDEAFKQKIILVSPTTLLVALRAVENTWRYEKQAQSISDVYFRAEELYKKFNSFVDDLQKVGKNLDSANNAYEEAFKKLSTGRGNLVNQASMLKKISNIKPKNELDSALVEKAELN